MRILITNDDGINAEGLRVLHQIADEIAGESGEVWTVAPAFEQSGVAHATSHAKPTLITKYSERVFAAEGSPADCVLAGVHEVMGSPPDLVLSGVNRGNNSAENACYSGTLGAAMEAALQGLPAIALSQYLGPKNWEADDRFEASRVHGAELVRTLLQKGLWDDSDYRLFYNVNFPPVPAAEVHGTKVTRQGFRQIGAHRVTPFDAPNGRKFLWISSASQQVETPEGTDAAANVAGYISVTPMRADFTAHDILTDLQTRLE